jgi:cell division protein FtsW
LPSPDFTLFLATILLVLGGLVMVYSASAILANERYGNSHHFFLRQSMWIVLGALAGLWASRVDLARLRPFALPILLATLGLMVLVMVPGIGREVRGAQRWIRLGPLSFQPSEALKLALVLFLADSLARRREFLTSFGAYRAYFIVLFVSIALLMKQHDFGTLLLVCCAVFAMFFLSGMRRRYFLLPAAVLLPVLVYLVQSVGYRMKRITAFINPWEDARGAGFQLIQSLIAVGSGGPLGVGLSNSTQKLFYLPDPHTDFIFAIIGEELGVWGALTVVFLFTVLVLRGFTVAARVSERTDGLFCGLLAAGVTGLIGLQAFVNLGVATGLLPTKGFPLPFVSYGGSSLLFTLLGMGLLLNISRQVKIASPLAPPGRA